MPMINRATAWSIMPAVAEWPLRNTVQDSVAVVDAKHRMAKIDGLSVVVEADAELNRT